MASLFSRTTCCRAVLVAVVVTQQACGGGDSGSTTPSGPGTKPSATAPGAPTGLVATSGDASITLAFSPPSNDGGAPVSSYTGKCSGSGSERSATGAGSPITVTGLANGTDYSCTVAATNSAGTGPASSPANARPVAAATAPSAPQNVVASTGVGSVTLTFAAPASNGGSAITSYVATCTATGSTGTATGTASPLTVTGLTGGVAHSCSVAARNAIGAGPASTAVSVTPAPSVAAQNCTYVQQSIADYQTSNTTGQPSVTCDATYAYFASFGIQTKHTMMNGITQTILQVPIPQNFTGNNAWRLPLSPTSAATKTAATDGPIGMAINGVPIFNPCKQGGCEFGDTKVQGELDICNGHAGRADDYHYHAAPVCLMADQSAHYWDTHPIGWALDGYGIFGYYNPDGTVATRDNICGGNTLPHQNAPAGYAYHVTDVSPYILSCFYGVPSPDLAGQGGKFAPLREPPPSNSGGSGVSNMTLDATPTTLAIGNTTTLQWQKGGTTYQILYKRTSSLCWNFIFKTSGVTTLTQDYCRQF